MCCAFAVVAGNFSRGERNEIVPFGGSEREIRFA